MAQTPWEVLKEMDISGKDAERFVIRCQQDLRRHLANNPNCLGVVDHLTKMLGNVVDLADASALKKPPITSNTKSLEGSATSTPKPGSAAPTPQSANSASTPSSPSPPLFGSQLFSGYTFGRIKARGLVHLHPCFMDTVERGVRAFLSQFLLKFIPEFQGVWVAYHPHVSALDKVGFVCEAETFGIITFMIEVDCLVFRPRPGCILAGIVTQVRPTHVGLSVHGLFNGSVRRSGLDSRFEFRNDMYLPKSRQDASVRLGSKVAFRVHRFHYATSGEMVSIEGSLLDRRRTGVIIPGAEGGYRLRSAEDDASAEREAKEAEKEERKRRRKESKDAAGPSGEAPVVAAEDAPSDSAHATSQGSGSGEGPLLPDNPLSGIGTQSARIKEEPGPSVRDKKRRKQK